MPGNGTSDQERKSGDWRRRMAWRRFWRAVYTVFLVLILGTVVGLGIAFRNRIAAFLWPPQPQRPVKVVQPAAPVQPPVERTVEKKEIETPPAATKVEAPPEKPVRPPEAPRPRDAEARMRIEKARGYYGEMRFDLARKECEALAADADVSDALKKDFQELAARCAVFDACVRHIEVAEHARGTRKFVEVDLGGRTLRGMVVEDTPSQITIAAVLKTNPASSGRSTFPIPKDQLSAPPREIPLSQLQEEFREFLREVEGGAPPSRSVDFYDGIYVSRRLNLQKECLERLERAYEMDPRLDETLRKELVRRSIEKAALFDMGGRTDFAQAELSRLLRLLPDFPLAQQEAEAMRARIAAKSKIKNYKATFQLVEKPARPEPAGPPRPSDDGKVEVAEKKGGGGTGKTEHRPRAVRADVDTPVELVMTEAPKPKETKAAAVAAEAEKYGREAQSWREKWDANRSSREANSYLQKGVAAADKAIELYDQLSRLDPQNADYWNSRAADIGMMRYQMFKSQTMDLGLRR
ncbi:MAG: hypothetical protein N3A38_15085 [Planctomycetota bacterium]|nr:hypothetical protein [Planctomycetota bacterium]